jgi:hypothetical protein
MNGLTAGRQWLCFVRRDTDDFKLDIVKQLAGGNDISC